MRTFAEVKTKEIMYERKIPVDLSCPLRLTMSLIDSKWKSCILDELRDATMRPSERHGCQAIYPELPPRSEYAITELGRSLLPILDAMITWGETNRNLFIQKYGKR